MNTEQKHENKDEEHNAHPNLEVLGEKSTEFQEVRVCVCVVVLLRFVCWAD